MAGSDRSGPEAASSQLFAGRNCIVTPTAHTSQETKRRAAEMWQALGMTVLYRSPEEHDRIVSRTSHLPHVAAAALTSLIDPEDRPFVGAGLRDTTRIAGGSPEIWTAILQNNRESLLAALDELRSELNRVESALMTDDRRFLLQWLDDAKRNRDALGG
jgi:prephenate dehydrogenase